MTMTYHDEHMLDQAAMLVMRGMIALQPTSELGPVARSSFDALMEKTPAAGGVGYEAAKIGEVAGWWCRPVDPIDGAAILYLHGGAKVLGSASAYRNFAGQLAMQAKAATFVADYGLAPERPFPAAFIDALATYRGLITSGRTRIALAGDSAGGGLALALAQSLTNKDGADKLLSPSAVAVMSPWIDLALVGDSMKSKASSDPLLSIEVLSAATTTPRLPLPISGPLGTEAEPPDAAEVNEPEY